MQKTFIVRSKTISAIILGFIIKKMTLTESEKATNQKVDSNPTSKYSSHELAINGWFPLPIMLRPAHFMLHHH